MLRFDAILFDLDGTLADSIADIAASVNHVRDRMGMSPLPVKMIQGFVGDGVHMLMQRALRTKDGEVVKKALSIQRPFYETHCLDQTVLYPDVRKMLETLATQPIPLGVVSNKMALPAEIILKGLGIRRFFKVVVGGDTISCRKPDPRPLQLAVKQMKIRSGRVLVVGDSPNDILSAQRAEYASCAVTWGFGTEDAILAAHPDHLVGKPGEILGVMGLP